MYISFMKKGSDENAKPLIISHGWPGPVVEFIDFIDLLAHPEYHGGNIEGAFDVVAPSLLFRPPSPSVGTTTHGTIPQQPDDQGPGL